MTSATPATRPQDTPPAGRDDLAAVLRDRSVHSVFQPIVDLRTGDVVAHEALTRGPAGPLARPEALIDAARARGRLAELDLLCWSVAVGSLHGGRVPVVFLNAEPEGLGRMDWSDVEELAAQAAAVPVRIVVEVTERAIATHHVQLLETVQRFRALGWGIAVDDVGVSPASLAFLPLIDPDVVKLDVSLIQDRPSQQLAQIVHAVRAFAERSGCLVLAEGIETPEHLEAAQDLGAQLGQGWFFGRPAPATTLVGASSPTPLRTPRPRTPAPSSTPGRGTPLLDLRDEVVVRRGSKRLIVELSHQLEEQALALAGTCVLVTTFQRPEFFTASARRRYRGVKDGSGYVYVLGPDLPPEPGSPWHTVTLPRDDPLAAEWYVLVLAPHFHAALMAHEVAPDDDLPGDATRGAAAPRRVFDYTLTYRHSVVTAAARALLSHPAAQPRRRE
ncbi:EAL domain-containing protein [Kineococcus sp. GCM10028916]|uniref:sensor domain-containing phosphodiesterase n=1 Tax=Kineococcus sp. GCM10028916 TaxID=3273394 RepID=UPI00363766CF